MQDLKTLWNWFITSSQNPEKTSLAIVGVLTTFSGYILTAVQIACSVGLTCLPIDNDTLTGAVNAISSFIEGALMIGGAIIFIVGLLRKLYNQRWTAAK